MTLFLTAALLISIIIFVSAARIALGPTIADSVIALDTTNTLGVSLLLLLSMSFNQAMLAEIAIVYALLSFIATLYFAKSLEGKKLG